MTVFPVSNFRNLWNDGQYDPLDQPYLTCHLQLYAVILKLD